MDNGQTVYGTVEIKGRTLLLAVNSAQRAQEGITVIMSLVGNMVGKPLTEIETVEQAMHDQRQRAPEEAAFPPEIATEIIHQTMDRHYRETLDQPVGMLNDQTPLQRAVKCSSNGSSSSKITPDNNLTPMIQWQPTILHGYGRNSASKDSESSHFWLRTIVYRISVSQ